MRSTVIFLFGLFLAMGCGPREKGSSTPLSQMPSALETARALSDAGDHLNASRYLELAYNQGADEETILPLLTAEQVRSGRLLAALHTTERLRELYPDRVEIVTLQALIRELVGLEVASDGKGARP